MTLLSLLVSSIFLCMSICSSLNTDGLSLLALKSAIDNDPTRVMNHWSESDKTPCHWSGISCAKGRVTSLTLTGKSLSGYIPSELGLLNSLTKLDLSHNNLTKLVPAGLFESTKLRYIDLSHNSISGSIPSQIKSMKSLNHLDLSSNQLNGSLPESLTDLKSLTGTLNLSFNRFTGEIPPSYGRFPVYVGLDFAYNNLTGKIPKVGSLLNQRPISFAGNSHLCGFPLQTQCEEEEEEIKIPKPENSKNLQKPNPSVIIENEGKEKKKITGSVTVSLISGVSIVIGAVSVSVWIIRRKQSTSEYKTEKKKKKVVSEFDEEGQNGKFVSFDEGFELELEDLLRASAYVIGKSRTGIVYRVVSSESSSSDVVAVRRLDDGNGNGNATWRFKDFENEVEIMSEINHPNIVKLRGYYYAEDEKLLITDFITNGSLYSALHGGPLNARPTLSWAERLRIAQGTARGLMYIHEYSSRKYVHGNLKSSKILLDDELHPRISGFGLTRLVSGYPKLPTDHSLDHTFATRVSAPQAAYLAPEARASSSYGSKSSQKCDVYSFGVILLELLTGRLPNGFYEAEGEEFVGILRKWHKEERSLSEILDPKLLNQVFVDKQVVATIRIALNCTEMDPEMRPRMRSVSESLGRIKSE